SPPVSVSLPAPPNRKSLPPLPSRVSFPAPPNRRSPPEPPVRVSFPASPKSAAAGSAPFASLTAIVSSPPSPNTRIRPASATVAAVDGAVRAGRAERRGVDDVVAAEAGDVDGVARLGVLDHDLRRKAVGDERAVVQRQHDGVVAARALDDDGVRRSVAARAARR